MDLVPFPAWSVIFGFLIKPFVAADDLLPAFDDTYFPPDATPSRYADEILSSKPPVLDLYMEEFRIGSILFLDQ